jgi:signal transduction histidine kinase
MNDRFAIIGRLAAGVAHDLNNYLAVVDASFTLRQRRPETESRCEADAREAVRSATRLTRCLLEYARGGSPEPAAVHLGALVHGVFAVFGRVVPSQVQLELALEGDAPPVRGVQAELEQLVINLVINACDAMPDGGQLFVAVRHSGASVILEVTDTGAGVADEVCAAGGADSPSSKPGRVGNGLGLGIVRSVAERHDALVHIGKRAGGGTRVMVVFPAG